MSTDDTRDAPDDGNGVTAEAHFAIVPEELLYDTSISDGAARLYGILDRHANNQRMAWPSRARLARILKCSVDTIDRRNRELVGAGWMKMDSGGTTRDGDKASNVYHLMRLPGRTDAAGNRPQSRVATGRTDAAQNRVIEPKPFFETENELALVDAFERFWVAYPKRNGAKVGKANARKQWAKLKPDEREAAYGGLQSYAIAKDGYPEDAERYLRNKRWVGLEVELPQDRSQRMAEGALRFAEKMGMK